jgi:dihydrofolate reductase
MAKLIVYMFTSADGFIAGPNGEFDPYEPSAEEMDFANEFFGAMSGVAFGRKTYEGFHEYWDGLDATTASERNATFASVFRRLRRVVFSRTLTRLDDPLATLVRDDIATRINALKDEASADLLLICGPELLGALLGHGLVDEVALLVKPRIQGHGTSLFRDAPSPFCMHLVETRPFASGAVLLRYRVGASL